MKNGVLFGLSAALVVATFMSESASVRADEQFVAKAKNLVNEAVSGLVATTNPTKPELELSIDDFSPSQGGSVLRVPRRRRSIKRLSP